MRSQPDALCSLCLWLTLFSTVVTVLSIFCFIIRSIKLLNLNKVLLSWSWSLVVYRRFLFGYLFSRFLLRFSLLSDRIHNLIAHRLLFRAIKSVFQPSLVVPFFLKVREGLKLVDSWDAGLLFSLIFLDWGTLARFEILGDDNFLKL